MLEFIFIEFYARILNVSLLSAPIFKLDEITSIFGPVVLPLHPAAMISIAQIIFINIMVTEIILNDLKYQKNTKLLN